ncbi:MAG: ABC transporter ATP-binding protein [Chloroflexi bacterium]|nr:MAG: ABC transporter ATP-binding protein [Chloroflexota bacterium]MBL1194685.1 ABC transporter ATP-binding protein [Chloroflexota bacterium]NOH11976.1 ABC transporter ATP-binding protein [Chloroflexota bacterium]
MAPVLELRGITKRFPGVLANDQIDLTLEKGEIHALLGENGAGKTTLMNILYGLYQPDEGEIFINGERKEIFSPNDAIEAGVGMVHQHFMLIPVFTVTENVFLGDEATRMAGLLDRNQAAERIRDLSEQYKLEVIPEALVENLPVGVQQRVEIIKLLYRSADILILDEPTAVLTPQEADELFKIMRSLTEQGKSIIFITHKLREVLDVADQISVIRRGKMIGSTTPKEANQQKLASMMVGRDVDLTVDKTVAQPGDAVLEVKDLVVANDENQVTVDGISFDVCAGEILGVAGVQGNGQTELVRAVTGLKSAISGSIELLGTDITHSSPRRITELGAAHIPEDRQEDGLVLSYPLTDNLVLNTYYQAPFAKGVVLQDEAIRETAEERIKEYDVRTPSAMTTAGSLSGGNQQKVIVARELSRPIKFLVAAQPTRGLDVGSIEYIHGQLIDRRDKGVAVMLVSTELDEIMQLSDRIAVMYRGEIIDVVSAQDTSKEEVGLLMAGVKSETKAKTKKQSSGSNKKVSSSRKSSPKAKKNGSSRKKKS